MFAQLGVRDADAERGGVCRVLREADGQHRVPDPRDRIVVFFTLLLVTGNTMAIAVRERTNELATLKAIGYTRGSCWAWCSVESMLIAAVGGALGLWLAQRRHRAGPDAGADPAVPADDRAGVGAGHRARHGLARRRSSRRSTRCASTWPPRCGGSRCRCPSSTTCGACASAGPRRWWRSRHRRHGRRVRRDAGAGARLPGDDGVVGPADKRDRAAGRRRLRDDERRRARAVRASRTRRRSCASGADALVSPEVVVVARCPCAARAATPTCRCAACRRACSKVRDNVQIVRAASSRRACTRSSSAATRAGYTRASSWAHGAHRPGTVEGRRDLRRRRQRLRLRDLGRRRRAQRQLPAAGGVFQSVTVKLGSASISTPSSRR